MTLSARALVVVGDCPPDIGKETMRLAEEQGWPVISEPSGNARSGPHAISTGGWLLGAADWLDDTLPDQVLVVGRPTLSRAVTALLGNSRIDVFAVAAGGQWADPSRNVAHVLSGLPAAEGHHQADVEWLARWRSAEDRAREVVDTMLDAAVESEQHAVRSLHAALPSDALIVAGSSLPIRHLFLCARPREGVTTIANRGASGIDGTTSTAFGAAHAWQSAGGGPTVALMGDLTFLHDSNGLLSSSTEADPDLTIVVLNNDGGGIFELLEQSERSGRAAFERVFATPHGTDLAAVCGASQVPFTRVGDPAELTAAVLDPRNGRHVVEVRTDRVATAGLQRRVQEEVTQAANRS
jgi:2-succinyl-5-enolpyruvyl-6-hydroxy-3-cyclohexene-1-carboxylate synthase